MSKMYSNSNIDNKIKGIIFCLNLNSNNEKSSHISLESQAPKWFLAGAVLGNKDRNHVYSGGEAVKTRQKTFACVLASFKGATTAAPLPHEYELPLTSLVAHSCLCNNSRNSEVLAK